MKREEAEVLLQMLKDNGFVDEDQHIAEPEPCKCKRYNENRNYHRRQISGQRDELEHMRENFNLVFSNDCWLGDIFSDYTKVREMLDFADEIAKPGDMHSQVFGMELSRLARELQEWYKPSDFCDEC